MKIGRMMLGETNPADSKPGTIRGDYCVQIGRYVSRSNAADRCLASTPACQTSI